MAASLTLVSATPYSLKYEWVHDGAGSGTADRTQAQMVTDCLATGGPNPLKDLLAGISLDATWDALDRSPKLSLYTTINNLPLGSSVAAEFTPIIGDRVLRVSGLNANPGRAIIEVRFHHTIDR